MKKYLVQLKHFFWFRLERKYIIINTVDIWKGLIYIEIEKNLVCIGHAFPVLFWSK